MFTDLTRIILSFFGVYTTLYDNFERFRYRNKNDLTILLFNKPSAS